MPDMMAMRVIAAKLVAEMSITSVVLPRVFKLTDTYSWDPIVKQAMGARDGDGKFQSRGQKSKLADVREDGDHDHVEDPDDVLSAKDQSSSKNGPAT